MIGDARSDSRGDGQTNRVAELTDFIEHTSSQRLYLWREGVRDDEIRYRK
jgi:hypothetical protein